MSDTAHPPPPRFCGWHRPPGGRWSRVATGPTEADTWRLLLAQPASNGDRLVLPVGQHPDGPHPRLLETTP